MVAIDVDPLRGESAGVLLVPHDREEVTTLVDLHLKIEKKRGIKNGPQTVFFIFPPWKSFSDVEQTLHIFSSR